MRRIDTEDGLFAAGVPETNTKGTVVRSWWANTVQEELANVAEGAGDELDADDNAQLLYVLPVQVLNIAILRTITGKTDGQIVGLRGYYAAGDGGHGPLRHWVSGAAPGTYVDNGGSIIVPTGGNGSAAWVFMPPRAVTLESFGVVGDGVTLDTTAMLAAILASGLEGFGLLGRPAATYLVGDLSIVNATNVPAWIDFRGATLKANTGTTKVLSLENPTSSNPSFFVRNVILDGAGIATNGLYVKGLRKTAGITNIVARNCTADGILFEGSEGFGIYENLFGLFIAGGNGVGNGGAGVVLSSSGTQTRCNGNTFGHIVSQFNIGDGIEVDKANGNVVSGCTIERNNGYGVRLTKCSGLVFKGGFTENNHMDLALDDTPDGSSDEAFYLTANSTGVSMEPGGKWNGLISGDKTGADNYLPTDGRMSVVGNGISFGGGTVPAQGFNFDSALDIAIKASGGNKLTWLQAEDAWRFYVAMGITPSTPAALTGPTNDYDPGVKTGWWRISSTAPVNLTGIAGGTAGRQLTLTNVGAYAITIKHQTTSTAANRIICNTGADIVLGVEQSIRLMYDTGTARWRTL